MNAKKEMNGLFTGREAAALLRCSPATLTLKAKKALSKTTIAGKFTYYTQEEIDEIKDYVNPNKFRYVESYHEELRSGKYLRKYYTVGVYNYKLKRRFTLNRYTYNWLVAEGLWQKGIVKSPEGHVIHHVDFNPLNDVSENLKLMTVSSHRILHDKADPSRRNKVSIAMKKRWKDSPINLKGTIREDLYKKVKCLENNIVYASHKKAEKALELSHGSIYQVLKGNQKSAKGYHFQISTPSADSRD